MLRVLTEGGPYERGCQQGQTCADLARRWMARALGDLAEFRGHHT